jgi:ribonucleoside-diphosphate reductase alpha chain
MDIQILEKQGNNAPPISHPIGQQPGLLQVIKRNGTIVPYDENKIKIAVNKAFIAVEGLAAAASNRIYQQVDQITALIAEVIQRRMPNGGSIHIEDLQIQVESALMRSGEYEVARAYILYRE